MRFSNLKEQRVFFNGVGLVQVLKQTRVSNITDLLVNEIWFRKKHVK